MEQKKLGFKKLTQAQLKEVNDILLSKVDDLVDALELNIRRVGKDFCGCCSVHNGDNKTAFKLYTTGLVQNGSWKCYTRSCEKEFVSNLIGLVQARLSNIMYGWTEKGDKKASFKDALDFISDFIGKDVNKIESRSYDLDKVKFTNDYIDKPENPEIKWNIEEVKSKLLIPSKNFQTIKNFTPEILNKFCVGESTTSNQLSPMYFRTVVPIFNADGSCFVGATGRSLFKKCDKCSSFHSGECPKYPDNPQYCKWRNTQGLPISNLLFGYNFAKDEIKRTKRVILVEGPCDVIKAHQSGIKNCVSLFGISLKQGQRELLEISGAMDVFVVGDNDKGGQEMNSSIYSEISSLFNVRRVLLPDSVNDLDELSDSDVKNLLG